MEKMIWEKISSQWKLLFNAYLELSGGSNGIRPERLRNYLKIWDIQMSDQQFIQIFKKLDPDGDGKISYSEFLAQAN